MNKGTCYYYTGNDKPNNFDEGIAWIDAEDGSNPYPDLVVYCNGEWVSEDVNGDLRAPYGKILCIQKLEFPDE